MKKATVATLFTLVALPFVALAAADDVTLTTDTVIRVSSVDVSVSGSSATVESITVGSSSFDVTLAKDSTITVSGSSATLGTSSVAGGFTRSLSCDSGTSKLTLSNSQVATVTVTVSVSATACTTSSSSSSGGGGGAPGSSPSAPSASTPSVSSTATKQETAPVLPSVPATPQAGVPLPASPSPLPPLTFNKMLRRGVTNEEVRRLQSILATDAALYPEGLVTGYFGSATQRAIERFQIKYQIVSSGTPQTTGYGALGPKTRAKLAEVFGGAGGGPPAAEAPKPSAALTRHLSRGIRSGEVLLVQQILNRDPDTRIAESGPGSSGNETIFFGPATQSAVERFQVKYGIAEAGDPGYGRVGPKTRVKLTELLGSGQ
ncbi:MAG: Pry3p [Parcubacteria group bacterium Gr01-1014_72]|nr:MAG: Pry3p [Parcubacteria group bacterium Gr01-1014_72]